MNSPEQPPIWTPAADARKRTAMGRFFAHCASTLAGTPGADATYADWHAWSCAAPSEFWTAVWRWCGVVDHEGPASGVGDWRALAAGARMEPPAGGASPWFRGARLNFAENLLRHGGPEPAIIARDERGRRRVMSRDELRRDALRVASALRAAGVGPGDRVAGFLPNAPETVVAMLGAAAVGATWTSCSPDFGAAGVLDRFGQVMPRVLVVADGYTYAGKPIDCLARVREIVGAIASVEQVVVVPFLRDAGEPLDLTGIRGAVMWDAWLEGRVAEERFAALPFDHPLYVMYSSGTTGLPKCMVHGAGGTLLQHVKEHQLHCDIGAADRVFYFTTCGWMMWNWLVSALASGAAIVLYDGAPLPPSDPLALWRMAAEERVTVFGTSAKFLAACEAAGLTPRDAVDLSPLRLILSTGSPLAPHGYDYVARAVRAGIPLASISGGTDIVSCFMLGVPLLPIWRGELQGAGLGMAVDIWDADGRPLPSGAGELVCTKPFPSMPVAFWNDPDGAKYRDAYFAHFPGAWRHGDWVERTTRGGFVVHGRSDATLNPGGVRIGTAEIYREVEQVPGVVESIVVGQEVPDGRGGTDVRVVLFVRLADGRVLDDALREAIRARLRANASPHHVPKVIAQVHDIPRTISGKITELAVRECIHGRPVRNTDALANPGALEEYRHRVELQLRVDG